LKTTGDKIAGAPGCPLRDIQLSKN
jgi:hypothetical protein